jgi:hypothetical protein
MKQETLDKFHEAVAVLSSVAIELRERAHACRLLGLTHLGDDLEVATREIEAARDKVRTASGETCYDSARAAEEATGNMMMAVLATVSTKAAS